MKQTPILLGVAALLMCALVAYALFQLFHSDSETLEQALYSGEFAQAVDILEKPGSQASATEQLTLGNLYYTGLGVERDYAQAERLFRLSAMRGNSSAQYNMALLYHNGLGVAVDDVEAAAWFLLADTGGISEAENYLRQLSGSMNPNKIQQAQTKKQSIARQIETNQTQ